MPLLKPGTKVQLNGSAWAGESAVSTVEISFDGGSTWTQAKVGGVAKPQPFLATEWSYDWNVPAQLKGPIKVVVKCTDTVGRTQPIKRDTDRRTYMINHLVPVEIVVR